MSMSKNVRDWRHKAVAAVRLQGQEKLRLIEEHRKIAMLLAASASIGLVVIAFLAAGRTSAQTAKPAPQSAVAVVDRPKENPFAPALETKVDGVKTAVDGISDRMYGMKLTIDGLPRTAPATKAEFEQMMVKMEERRVAEEKHYQTMLMLHYPQFIREAEMALAKSNRNLAKAALDCVPLPQQSQFEFRYLQGQLQLQSQPHKALPQAGPITAIAAAPRGGLIVIGENTAANGSRAGSTLRIFDERGNELKTRPGWSNSNPGSLSLEEVRFVEKSKIVAVGCADTQQGIVVHCARQFEDNLRITAWDLETGRPIGKTREIAVGTPDLRPNQVAFHPRKLDVTVAAAKIQVGKPLQVARFVAEQDQPVLVPDSAGVNALTYNNTGTALLLVRDDITTICDEMTEFKTQKPIGAGGRHGAFGPDGKLLAIALPHSVHDQQKVVVATCPEDRVEALLTSPRETTCLCFIDATRLLIGTSQGEVEVQDLVNQKTLLVLRGGGKAVSQIVYDRQMDRIVTISDETIRIWETK
jgi:hypothetical protein